VTADGPDLRQQECNYAKARVCIEPNNRLSFFFEKSSMKPCTAEQYFGSGFFEMEEAFNMPEAILNLLGIDHYIVYPGKYRIIESKSFMKVIF
jgi:hypothetical protein